MDVVVEDGLIAVVCAVHLVQLFDAAAVHDGGVGQDGADDVVLGQLVVLGHLDAAQDVRDAGDAQPGQLLDQLVVKTKLLP